MKGVAAIVAADTTGEWEMGKYTGRRTSPTHDEIAQLAFSLYESRGRQDGYHVEDWLRAVFASPVMLGRKPLNSNSAQRDKLRPAAIRAGLNPPRLAFAAPLLSYLAG